MTSSEDMTFTLLAMACVALIGMFSFKRHFAVHDKPEPRMVPWMIIFLACVATLLMFLVHFVNLLGFKTGR